MSVAANAVRRLANNFSIEVTPAAAKKIVRFDQVDGLRAGTAVNVTYLVGANMEDSLETCEKLAAQGMRPVAHVPVRAFSNIAETEEYLSRLRDVGVDELLVLGGGASEPKGTLHESMQLLESGALQKHGFTRVGVAAHPEGHPDISASDLDDAMVRKATWGASEGVDLYFETQFCFDPQPIIEWERRTRALLINSGVADAGRSLPRVRLGVAGPAKISNLIKFGAMSGVGNSLQFLTKHSGSVLKLASKAAPDEVVTGVALHCDQERDSMIEGLHYYPFGGFASTLRWAGAVERGDFSVHSAGMGFTVA